MNAIALVKVFVYAFAWTIGGLFETEERDRFHKFFECLIALLTSISSQKMSVDKETVFDYYIRPETKNVIIMGG